MMIATLIILSVPVIFPHLRGQLTNVILDHKTSVKIASLHPAIREVTTQFIKTARSIGINVYVNEGLRAFDRQRELYNIGRNSQGQRVGSVVTNALPGQSYHNYGLAVDLVIINADGSYNYDGSDNRWRKLSALGKDFGYEWGGDWKSIDDIPHFQFTFGLHHSELLRRYNSGDLVNGYVNIN